MGMKMQYGSIQSPNGGHRPNGYMVRVLSPYGVVWSLFIHDHWVPVGPTVLMMSESGQAIGVVPPNLREFVELNQEEVEGLKEWAVWGSRVN